MGERGRVLCFGEVLLRLSAAQPGLLLQEARLDACFGGAEANVAVALAKLGWPSAMVSVLPDHRLGDVAVGELAKHGVEVRAIQRAEGRMGLYFLTPGAVTRASDIIYDRAGSAFAEAAPELIDWAALLPGAARLHLSGVTPAIGPNTAVAALRAARAAMAAKVPVSFDGNFRGKLWAAWGGDAPTILRALFDSADIAFAEERDMGLVLGATFEGADPEARRATAMAAAFKAFPKLQVAASTFRNLSSVGEQELTGALYRRGAAPLYSAPVRLAGVVDRIGGGDAFAAGLLYGLHAGRSDADALALAMASTAFKHSVPGDFSLATLADLEALMAGGLDVRR